MRFGFVVGFVGLAFVLPGALAEDVLALTQLYLASRFGGCLLTPTARRIFARGVCRGVAWQPA